MVLFIEFQFERRNCGLTKVLIEERGQVHASLLIKKPYHILRHDVLVLEALIKIVKELPPPRVVINDVAKRVEKQRSLKVHVLWRRAMDSAIGNDGRAILHLSLV